MSVKPYFARMIDTPPTTADEMCALLDASGIAYQPVDMKALAPRIGADHLSLGSPERLMRHLGVTPGSVTVLGLVHDRARAVTLLVDARVWRADAIRAHPLDNASTLVLAHAELERFLALTGHTPRVVDVP